MGFHQKLCFTSQNLVPFLHVSVSYTRIVFPYRTSLSLSYDVPPDRVPEVLLHLMRALEDVQLWQGLLFCVGNDLSYGQSLDLCHVYAFDETCKFELHCQFWYRMAALTERMNTCGSRCGWCTCLQLVSLRFTFWIFYALAQWMVPPLCQLVFVESTEVWGTQSCRSAVLALVLKGP